MKFVWSDKNRSINSTLNVLFFVSTLLFSIIFAFPFTIENPTGGSGDDKINSLLFFVVFLSVLTLFWIPFFLKKFRIIKYLGLITLIASAVLIGYIVYVDGNWYSIPIFVVLLFFTSIIIFICGEWKGRNKINLTK